MPNNDVVVLAGDAEEASGVVTPALRVRGNYFECGDGTRWTAIGTSGFNLPGAFFDQGEQVVRAVLAQWQDIGFTIVRSFTRYDIAGIGRCTLADHPDFYQAVPYLVDLVASYGMQVLYTCYVGPGNEDDPDHWPALGEAAFKAQRKPFLELVNENNVHPMDLSRYRPIAGLYCSHGSNGSQSPPIGFEKRGRAWTPVDVWDFGDVHTNEASEEQRKIGHNTMEWAEGTADSGGEYAIGAHRPMWTSEISGYAYKGMWVGASLERQKQLAYDSMAGAALLCAGSWFHSALGKTFSLFDAATEAVGRAGVAGARSVGLHAQDEAYRHRPDLEGAGVLRTYQRGDQIVSIRA